MSPPKNEPRPRKPPAGSTGRPEPEAGSDEAEEIRLIEAVRAAQKGGAEAKAQAWEALLLAFQDRLFGVCFRMVRDPDRARDLTQDAMVKVIQGLDSYDGRARLSTWMIRVTMNVCLSHLRKEKLRRHASLDASDGEGGSWGSAMPGSSDGGGPGTGPRSGREPDMLGRVEMEEARRMVLLAMDKIDPEQRAILTLRDVQDMDYRDIAEALDIPLGTVKSRIFRAREALRSAMEALGGGAADE